MNTDIIDSLAIELNKLQPLTSLNVVAIVDCILASADHLGATDIHFQPQSQRLHVLFRLDGVLTRAAELNGALAPNIIARLKVLSGLLTYRTEIPQEGSFRNSETGAEKRVSTFPTIHGENAMVRSFSSTGQLRDLSQLGLAETIQSSLEEQIRQRSGVILFTGPSGSGKTTTIYACLRSILAQKIGKHIVTIEDPVEQVLDGISQSQVRPGTEFDFSRGLRSLLRQDPDIIMVGEIRDPETANVAIQASLVGHLVFSTLHATSACGVVGRLLEMGIESYLLTSGIRAIVNQRLLRKLCEECRIRRDSAWVSSGCVKCNQVGYRGRFLVAELLIPNSTFRNAMLKRADTAELEAIFHSAGGVDLSASIRDAIRQGVTSWQEVERVLGSLPVSRAST